VLELSLGAAGGAAAGAGVLFRFAALPLFPGKGLTDLGGNMPMLLLEMLFIVLLMLVNGMLAMSELAVVSSRRSRLEHLAGLGNGGARKALGLIDDPSRFLSTVQIGITLVGILAGAFGGATIADRLGDWFDSLPALAPNGDAIAIGLVVVVITYLSVIAGELVPKRIALANPERVASLVAEPMNLLSRVAAPAVWLLKSSTEAVLRVLRLSTTREETITEDEVRSLIAEGTRAGIFVPREREMIDGVLRLADRSVQVIMTPRSDVVWIDSGADQRALSRTVETSRYSRLLVCEGSIDRAVGVIHTKHILPLALRNEPISLRALTVPAIIVPDRTSVLKLLDRFRREGVHMAVVVDEYGTTAGVATLTDVLESIAGELPELGEAAEPLIVQRDDGSWLVAGTLPIDEFEDRIGLRGLQETGGYYTVAGFVLHRLGHLPTTGESFRYRDARFEVVDMDGRRIDKVLVRTATDPDMPADPARQDG
jgi:putative hemolysin